MAKAAMVVMLPGVRAEREVPRLVQRIAARAWTRTIWSLRSRTMTMQASWTSEEATRLNVEASREANTSTSGSFQERKRRSKAA